MHEMRLLPNGVRILTEYIPHVRSAALGIWVGSGSRHEQLAHGGIAHFIEHMVFKGTHTRSAARLAEEMDAIGGQVNAYTTKENTCFYTRSLDTHLDQALDLLCDMFFCARFDEADVETERGVILEEIDMYEDSPEDLCVERLFSAVYRGTSLARPILGRPASLDRITGKRLRAWREQEYRPQETLVALAGSFTPAQVEEICRRFAQMTGEARPPQSAVPYQPAFAVRQKPIEQNHICLAYPGLPVADPRRYAMQLLSGILGGGASSRLFQTLREQMGLCYSIYTFGAGHADTGVLGIYAALGRENEPRALEAIGAVVRDFVRDGVTVEELDRAREQVKANVLMGMESTSARMSHLMRSAFYLGRVPDAEEIAQAYDAVTRDDLHALAEETLTAQSLSFSAVGQVRTAAQYRGLLLSM